MTSLAMPFLWKGIKYLVEPVFRYIRLHIHIGRKIKIYYCKNLWIALIKPDYLSSLRSEGCIYNKISDKAIETYP